MQKLRTLTAEHGLAVRVINHQNVTLLKALPLEDRLLASGFEKPVKWMLMHVPQS